MTQPTRRLRERGQALVESALVLIPFIAIAIGIFDVGYALFLHQTIGSRAQAAARWGAVNPYSAVLIQNKLLYGTPTPVPGQRPWLGLTGANVNVQHLDAGTSEDRIVVTVSGYSFPFFSATIVRTFFGGGQAISGSGPPISVSIPYEFVP
jgi:hypothetical protein